MQNYFQGKRLLIIVTGSIAAFKILDLISQLHQWQCEVRVVMTDAATQFVTPLSFEALTQQQVYTDLWRDSTLHIELAKWPDAILIAPATANFLAKITHGLADDLASTILLACQKPIAFAPAMNQAMWQHPATQKNVSQLIEWGYLAIPPDAGRQACGDTGIGNLAALESLSLTLPWLWQPKALVNRRVLITAGATREPLDPIRFLSNLSSGKMAAALARACFYQGALVKIITTNKLALPATIPQQQVETTAQMHQAVQKALTDTDIFMSAAAPCDFQVVSPRLHKIKKQQGLELEWTQTTDMLATAKQTHPAVLTIGFAAETQNLITEAKKKLKQKQADVILANLVGPNQGMCVDDNALTLITATRHKEFPKQSKDALAEVVVAELASAAKSGMDPRSSRG